MKLSNKELYLLACAELFEFIIGKAKPQKHDDEGEFVILQIPLPTPEAPIPGEITNIARFESRYVAQRYTEKLNNLTIDLFVAKNQPRPMIYDMIEIHEAAPELDDVPEVELTQAGKDYMRKGAQTKASTDAVLSILEQAVDSVESQREVAFIQANPYATAREIHEVLLQASDAEIAETFRHIAKEQMDKEESPKRRFVFMPGGRYPKPPKPPEEKEPTP